jgi:hypothetical protein
MITSHDIDVFAGRAIGATTLILPASGAPYCEPPLTDAQQAQLEAAWPDGVLSLVPPQIPLWAFRTALKTLGWWANVQALLANLPEPDKSVLTEFIEYGNFVQRSSPSLAQIAVALNKTSAQVDEVFVLGDSFKP